MSRTPEYHRNQQARYRSRPANIPKIKARKALEYAVKIGRLRRQPCARCGQSPAHGHHEDYSRPLDVVWLCEPCHATQHRRVA